jgi:cell division protein FtsL
VKELREKICFLSYIVSAILAAFLSFKVINVRSACTHEKLKITSVVNEIRRLKEENVRLSVEYYSNLKPENVDKASNDLDFYQENEVQYIK